MTCPHPAPATPPGSRDLLEQVVTKDISPPLQGAKFESKLVTISSDLLQQWYRTRCGGETSASAKSGVRTEGSKVKVAEDSLDEKVGGSKVNVAEESLDEVVEGSKVESEVPGESCSNVGSSLSGKQLLKLQKEAVCREFVANMKPHFKTKFKTKVVSRP